MNIFLTRKGYYFITIFYLVLSTIYIRSQSNTSFAVIGDYGKSGSAEEDVANLVHSWNVDFVITVGDNNYPDGEASTIDENIGQYYHQYIHPYIGSYGQGSNENRFFPSLGNHDWHTNPPQPYYDYFVLPNNERYYDFVWEDIHFFAIDSDSDEPDGVNENSTQGQWLQNKLSSSSSMWKVVYFHHAPYSSSSSHGSQEYMQWPFKQWGADVVLAGHDHTYERILVDDFPYFVNGLGGKSIYSFDSPIPGSQVRYNDDYGAMMVEANQDSMIFRFYSRGNDLVDVYTLTKATAYVESVSKLTYLLEQNYPNPFNPQTKIKFKIPEHEFVNLSVHNLIGSKVRTLVNEYKEAGSYDIMFDANTLPSGIYFYTLRVGSYSQSRKMILLK